MNGVNVKAKPISMVVLFTISYTRGGPPVAIPFAIINQILKISKMKKKKKKKTFFGWEQWLVAMPFMLEPNLNTQNFQ